MIAVGLTPSVRLSDTLLRSELKEPNLEKYNIMIIVYLSVCIEIIALLIGSCYFPPAPPSGNNNNQLGGQ